MKSLTELSLWTEECVTRKSLENAKVLVAEYGIPMEINIDMNTDTGVYITVAQWQSGVEFKFTGFSCGYYGEGCRGLRSFLNDLCGMEVSAESVASWKQDVQLTIFPRIRKVVTVYKKVVVTRI
jgi:hypothetical protein